VHRKPIQKPHRSLALRILGPSLLIGIGSFLATVAFAASEIDPESVSDPEDRPVVLTDPVVVTDNDVENDVDKDGEKDGENEWQPEVGLGFLLHVQGLDGSATSNFMDTDARSVSDKAISPGFRLSVGMRSPVLAQAGGFKPRLFFQTGIQYLLEDKYTSYRGTVTETRGYTSTIPSANCDVPAFGQNVKGLIGDTQGAIVQPTPTSGGYYQNFVEGPVGTHYQDIQQLLPDLFSPDIPSNPNLAHGYDQEYIEQSPSTFPSRQRLQTLVAVSGGFGIGGSDCDSNFRAKTSIDLMWELGVGVEFTIPVLSRQFHLRVSADYRGQSFGETEGTWDRASAFEVCMAPPTGGLVGGPSSNSGCLAASTSPIYTSPGGFSGNPPQPGYPVAANHKKYGAPRVFASGTGAAFTTHAIGPTVQVDVDVFKRGDLRINLFLQLGFAWLINDAGSSLSFEAPDQIYNCTIDTSSPLCAYKVAGQKPEVEFSVVPQSLISQGGGGIRILWSPPW